MEERINIKRKLRFRVENRIRYDLQLRFMQDGFLKREKNG